MTTVVFLGLSEVMVDRWDIVRGSNDHSCVPRVGRGCDILLRDIVRGALMRRNTVCLLRLGDFCYRAYSVTMEN
ncbi:hypothetical protein DPMN_073746 [Dreissena polymorpha]|uniref:Uncharacterized protein n=1 Tax=Dreissena polymorpha TaxID=45954 RepID=A0A9D4BZP1_DREPO|nr:hypothetical protein DPMN_073746 [Dreissena polymorpha]